MFYLTMTETKANPGRADSNELYTPLFRQVNSVQNVGFGSRPAQDLYIGVCKHERVAWRELQLN